MTEWYRNKIWNEEIETMFEAKIARARTQKAQYLKLQGMALTESHPQIAVELLQRCANMDDPHDTAHAYAEMASAYLRLGDHEAMYQAMESALAAEERHPKVRTSVRDDYAMMVALNSRAERYDRALALINESKPAIMAVYEFERYGAKALILNDRGEHEAAIEAARTALRAAEEEGWIPGHPEVGSVPHLEHEFGQRIIALANLDDKNGTNA